jgi:GNAT superfamily N-acetyltransferase
MTTSDVIAPSLDQVARTLAADISYTVSRMKVLERLPGNPVGIDYLWLDDRAVALMCRLLAFCRVIGLRAGHEQHIERLVAWYRDRDVRPTFEMVPGHHDASLGSELARHGFHQSGFHTVLIGTPAPSPPPDGLPPIERVATPAAMAAFLDAYVAGWAIPAQDHARFKANVEPWLEQPGWSLYVGRVDGQPAAAAILYAVDGMGFLADAATSPAFRGRGLQTALLRRRMYDAGAMGMDTICSGAAPFSTSHRNMERAGLRVLFVRALWTPA